MVVGGWCRRKNTLTFCPKFFSWLLYMYIDFEKNLGKNLNVRFFMVAS